MRGAAQAPMTAGDVATPRRFDHVVIIGAGFSGTLQAINLARHQGPRATLIERRSRPGRGVAYSTAHANHLLNVRAANMSALSDDPGHFARWIAARGGDVEGFATRIAYGDYLAELLDETMRAAPGRIEVRHDQATEVALPAGRAAVTLVSGEQLDADAVILALGNLPPFDPPGVVARELPRTLYAPDPWAADVTDDLDRDAPVLIVGTGLTMVDVALMLDARGHRGRITALSRHGLLPRSHGDTAAPAPRPSERPAARGSDLLRDLRRRAEAVGWRKAVDELRSYSQSMWLDASFEQQARFLRHLRPWWDVHRHRLAPSVARQISAMRERGQLAIVAGRLASCRAIGGEAEVGWYPRGQGRPAAMRVSRIMNCTGPQGDLLRTREPLLHLLLAGGHIRPDRHRLGVDVTAQAETIDARGKINRNLLALGPMTRGAFWEIVAVPDLRLQTWSVARKLSHSHWVAAGL